MDTQRLPGRLQSWIDERTIADALAQGGILWLAGRAVLFVTLLVGWMVLL